MSEEQNFFFRGSKLILVSDDGSKKMTLTLDNDGGLSMTSSDGKVHRVLLTGLNSQSGEVVFNETKSMQVEFPTAFAKWPSISLTLADQNNTPPHRLWPGKTKFTVRFKSPFTGVVAWTAVEA